MITVREWEAPPISQKEILRYAGCSPKQEPTEAVLALLAECLAEAEELLSYRACFCRHSLFLSSPLCRFDGFEVSSRDLCRALSDCDSAFLFAATVGIGMDRLVAKYARTYPAKALLLQAIGAERIEALCDLLIGEWSAELLPLGKRLRPRFSPGYGDLSLQTQRQLFSVLDCPRQIGLSLNESLLMTPTKSVTAIVGIF